MEEECKIAKDQLVSEQRDIQYHGAATDALLKKKGHDDQLPVDSALDNLRFAVDQAGEAWAQLKGDTEKLERPKRRF